MMFRTMYSQETLEHFKSLIRDDKLLKRIKGYIVNEKWIYFYPIPFDKIKEKKIRTIIRVKATRVKSKGWNNRHFIPFQFK